MAIIDEVNISDRALSDADAAAVKLDFRAAIWAWYHAHEGDTIAHVFIFKIHLRDVKHVIQQLIGPDPTGA